MDTALITIATALLTAGAALAGVYLTNRENSKRLKLQLDHESEKKHRDLQRKMAEELYELTDEWLSGLFVKYINLSSVMKGEMNYNQYHDQLIEYGNKSKSKFVRLEMIISIYFPELTTAYEKVIEMRGVVNDISIKHKHAYEKGDIDGERFLKPYTNAHLELEEYGDKLKEEIAQCARNA